MLKKHRLFFEYLLVLFVAFFPLLFDIGASYIQPTADLWIERSIGFMTALGRGDFAASYQQYHPGVTVMWLVAIGSWFYYRIAPSQFGFFEPNILAPDVFTTYAPFAKFPLMLGLGALMVLFYVVLKRIAGRKIALFSLVLLAFEPFYVASARSIHLDAMLTMTMFVAALLLYVSFSHPVKSKWFLATGVMVGLAFLSKIVTIYLVPFIGLALLLQRMTWRERVQRFTGLLGIALLTFTLLFPAVLVAPFETLWVKIIAEGIVDTGVQETSRSLMINYSEGLWYHSIAYPVTALYRFSPFLTIGLLGWLVSLGHLFYCRYREQYNPRGCKDLGTGSPNLQGSPAPRFWLFLGLFSFFYLVMMGLSTKKIYRYVLPVFPALAIFAAYGWYLLVRLLERTFPAIKSHVFNLGLGLLLLGYVLIFFAHSPHFFAYFNPLLGGIEGASKVVMLNQDATAYEEIAHYLNQKDNAKNLSIASYDWKILGMLFMGETVSAKRAEKPLTTDYILLPIQRGHEWVTEEYELERVFEVNGVEYWFLYEHKKVIE